MKNTYDALLYLQEYALKTLACVLLCEETLAPLNSERNDDTVIKAITHELREALSDLRGRITNSNKKDDA